MSIYLTLAMLSHAGLTELASDSSERCCGLARALFFFSTARRNESPCFFFPIGPRCMRHGGLRACVRGDLPKRQTRQRPPILLHDRS
ncbi:hypothetical protein BJV74DRAFT_122549 [Russula compacta]|nr:hypothetical protein BJV74DRAFT_122549 [Russula compacta]